MHTVFPEEAPPLSICFSLPSELRVAIIVRAPSKNVLNKENLYKVTSDLRGRDIFLHPECSLKDKRLVKWSSVFPSGEAFSREENRFLEKRSVFYKRRSVFSNGDASSRMEKRFL